MKLREFCWNCTEQMEQIQQPPDMNLADDGVGGRGRLMHRGMSPINHGPRETVEVPKGLGGLDGQ